MSLAGRDVQASEALGVFDFRVSAAVQEHFQSIFHVNLGGHVERRVSSNRLVIDCIHLCVELQQDVNDCDVLGLHCELEPKAKKQFVNGNLSRNLR